MTFGPDHYVPVLKVKRGEKKALQCISPKLLPRIIPLLEIVERKADKAPTVEKHLDTSFKDLAQSVRPYSRCFLDAREIAFDGEEAAAQVFRRAASAGIVFTPVTGISRKADVTAAMGQRTHGLALRLSRDEFENGDLEAGIEDFLSKHALTPEEVDLIIDLGPVEDLIVEGIAALTDAFLADVPDHQRWRTFTVSACSFPRSMGRVERYSHDLVKREESLAWRDYLFARRQKLRRLPTFSDCGIQHPAGVEGFDPRTMQMSATIRYSLEDAWLLLKGESIRTTRPGEQFPALATELVYGYLKKNFAGPNHCDGCRLMKAADDGAPGLGSAEAWRRLGTIHHTSVVMQGLSSLPWP